ncbi:hypothetical protein RJ639_044880 [Escallonia herrerae]|uniref:Uncharacterized protein n=1 Tax=Escallonia herrerae TaxID=1293975 RepID=A0AA88WCB4_9ASTE|nr:hypothetical protein RJ639_044880 [Escallonia herrerae]
MGVHLTPPVTRRCYNMKVDIISKDKINPASPTPLLLRRYQLSILDQIVRHFYVPWVLFYLNNNKNTTPINFSPIKSNYLKHTLSETLTHYYPFAGKVKDDLNYIDCNDEGVYYVEAKVSYSLKEFRCQPDMQLIQLLTPNNPQTLESMSRNYVILVQVNIFYCGGIAIGTCASHKIADAATFSTFMNAWSRVAACGSLEVVQNPSFTAPSLFPPNASVLCKWPFKASGKNESMTRRFVFDGAALAALRAQAASIPHVRYPTSVEAVGALIWGCVIEAISKHMPHAKVEFPCMVDCIRKAIAKVDNDFIESIKGNEGYAKVKESLKEYAELLHNIDEDNFLIFSSLRKAGIYEVDFGWGKPTWCYFCNPSLKSAVVLMDTRSGDGIEAIVRLNGQAMAIFERDQKLLLFASDDPSPL